MARSRRSYARDSRGRFASTPGGPARAASGLPKRQARKMGAPPPRRRGLVTQRAAVRRSAAKLKGLDASGSYSGALKQRGQRAAVTRAANRLQAAQQSGRRRLRPGAQQGVIRPGRGPRVMNPEVMPRDRVPASQRPGSMTSTLRGLMRGLAQADARRIREVEAITGQRVTMPSTPPSAGARVRATAKGGKVAGTMRAALRELAQSDARTIREMESIIRDATPKMAGAKGGKALRGGRKALPTRKAAKSTRRRKPS